MTSGPLLTNEAGRYSRPAYRAVAGKYCFSWPLFGTVACRPSSIYSIPLREWWGLSIDSDIQRVALALASHISHHRHACLTYGGGEVA